MLSYVVGLLSSGPKSTLHREHPIGLWIITASFLALLALVAQDRRSNTSPPPESDCRLESAVLRGDLLDLRQIRDGDSARHWSQQDFQPHIDMALRVAAARGDISILQQLLDWGADPNCRSPVGKTPLMCAAGAANSAAIARRLLAAGANLSARDNQSHSALTIAAAARDHDLIAALSAAP